MGHAALLLLRLVARFLDLQRKPSLDWLLPISLLGLALQSGGDPATMVLPLVIWLALRLLQRIRETPLAWALLGILSVSLATLLQPPSRSHLVDPLLLLIAFAVGTARPAADWRRTLSILALTLLPAAALVRFDRLNDNRDLIPWQGLRDWIPEQAMRLQDVAINDSAYIFILLTLCAWVLLRWGTRGWQCWPVALLVLLGYGLLFGTGSRAGLVLPVLIAIALELLWWQRAALQRLTWASFGVLLLLVLLFMLGFIHPAGPLAERNISDTGRAYVGRCFSREAVASPLLFFTGHGGDVVNERCNRATRWSEQPEGLRHAHNQYLQTLADFGAIPLLLLLVGLGACWGHAIRALPSADPIPALLTLMATLVLMSFSLIEPVLLAVSFKQILSGYLLAAAWPAPGVQSRAQA